jgi:hypothetical protein
MIYFIPQDKAPTTAHAHYISVESRTQFRYEGRPAVTSVQMNSCAQGNKHDKQASGQEDVSLRN